MITRTELDRLIKSLPKQGLAEDEWRTAASVATGAHYEKTLSDIIKFYSLDTEVATKWWDQFNFSDAGLAKESTRKSKPQKVLDSFVRSNVGLLISIKTLSESCGVSVPTVYGFVDSHRHWFKKIGRGRYEIIDAEKEREMAKK